ncbi:MAG: hypothetical protein IJ875_00225, partial [Solobacterium sp.]|nr:hypothetical protein [Solobacterium sp.]
SYKTVEIVFEELHVLNISMEGIGHITYADAYEELSYAEEDLAQNIITTYIGEYKVAAVADDPDYAFEKWVVNGKDYSTDKETTIYLEEEDLEMIAVFKLIPTEKATLALRNGVKEDYYSNLEIDGVLFTLTEANQIQLRTAYEGYEGIENVGFVCDPEGKLLFIYNVENGKYYYGPDYHDVTYEISDEIRAFLQERVAHPKEDDDAEFIDALQQIVEFYKTVEITFAPLTKIEASVGEGGGFITYADEGEELSYNMEDLAQSIVTPYAGENKFGAVPNKGYSFVKWIKDGEDYSTDKEISVTLEDKDIELKAIFKHEPGQFIYKEQEDNLGKATIADKTIDLNATLNISLEEVEAMNEGEDIYLILRSKENSDVIEAKANSAIEKKLT